MHGYNFTESLRRVLALSGEEAVRFQHEYVGSEHLLLALVAVPEGGGAVILHALSVSADDIRRRVDQATKRGRLAILDPTRAFTSRAKRILEYAMDSARELGHADVGTEHLLIGLVREGNGIGGQVLRDAGVTEPLAIAQATAWHAAERTGSP